MYGSVSISVSISRCLSVLMSVCLLHPELADLKSG